MDNNRRNSLKSPGRTTYGRLKFERSQSISPAYSLTRNILYARAHFEQIPDSTTQAKDQSRFHRRFSADTYQRTPVINVFSNENDLLSIQGGAIMSSTDDIPPFQQWIIPALLCAFAYALYNTFIKKGSDSIHPVLGGVVLQIVAAMFGSLLLLTIIVTQGTSDINFDSDGIKWSIFAGVAVGLAELLSFFVMGTGVPAVQAVPIIIGGSVLFGTILGFIWLDESLSIQGWIGVILLVLGIGFVATDPGNQTSNT